MAALSGILRSSSECCLNRVKVYVKEVSLCDDSSFISRLPRFSVFLARCAYVSAVRAIVY
jgi:hypothetical protein